MRIIYRIDNKNRGIYKFISNLQVISDWSIYGEKDSNIHRYFLLKGEFHRIGGPAIEIVKREYDVFVAPSRYYLFGIRYDLGEYWEKVNAGNL